MAIIETINSAINGVVWGVPMLVLLVGAGTPADHPDLRRAVP